MRRRIEKVLEELRPALRADGGDVELVDYRDGIAYLELQGACRGCPASTATLKGYLEKHLLKRIPRLKGVESV